MRGKKRKEGGGGWQTAGQQCTRLNTHRMAGGGVKGTAGRSSTGLMKGERERGGGGGEETGHGRGTAAHSDASAVGERSGSSEAGAASAPSLPTTRPCPQPPVGPVQLMLLWQIWDMGRDSSTATASYYVFDSVRCMSVDWAAGVAALGCQSGSVALWNLEAGRKLQVRRFGRRLFESQV